MLIPKPEGLLSFFVSIPVHSLPLSLSPSPLPSPRIIRPQYLFIPFWNNVFLQLPNFWKCQLYRVCSQIAYYSGIRVCSKLTSWWLGMILNFSFLLCLPSPQPFQFCLSPVWIKIIFYLVLQHFLFLCINFPPWNTFLFPHDLQSAPSALYTFRGILCL